MAYARYATPAPVSTPGYRPPDLSFGMAPAPAPAPGPQLGFGTDIASFSQPASYPAPALPSPGVGAPAYPTVGGQTRPMGRPSTMGAPAAPAAPGGEGGWFSNTFRTENGGLNLENISALAETIGSFGSLWSGLQANKIAKQSLGFQKEAYNTNLANQISTFNTNLADRTAARAAQNGTSQAEQDAYIARNRMKG